jgi:hypothetical protein
MTTSIAVRRNSGQRTARTGDAQVPVRQSALCRMGFGQTHGAHGIFLTKEKYQCRPSSHPHRIAPTFSRGRACRAFCGSPCLPRGCGARWGVRCRATGVRRCGWPESAHPNFAASITHLAATGRLQRLDGRPYIALGQPRLGPAAAYHAAPAAPTKLAISMNIKESCTMNHQFKYSSSQGRSVFSYPTSQSISIRESRNAKR